MNEAKGLSNASSWLAMLVPRKRLTTLESSVTINPIRGDKETRVEFQPHLNSGLWPVYLTECDMRYVEPPTDGRQEAPGALPQNDE